MVRNVVRRLRRKLRDDAENPAYIFIEPRVGYRMARAGAGAGMTVAASRLAAGSWI